MNIRKITLTALGATAVALAAWFIVGMFISGVLAKEIERNAHALDEEEKSARETALLRLHSLARDTKEARAQLDSLTKTEVLKIANMIEDLGRVTGVDVSINGAEPESAPAQTNAKAPPLRAVNFLVESEGTFPALMHTVVLLENLPVLSSLQNLELEREQNSEGAGKNNKPLWRLNAQVKVMTSTEI